VAGEHSGYNAAMKRIALLVALVAPAPAWSQSITDAPADEAWTTLLAKLADPMQRDFAIAAMDEVGPIAVRRLVSLVDEQRPEAARQIFYAIAELAHHAAADHAAIARLAKGNPELVIDLFDLRTTLLPFLDSTTATQAWQTMLAEMQRCARDRRGDEEFVQRFRRLWVRFYETQAGEGRGEIALGSDVPLEDLLAAMPQHPGSIQHYVAALARLLSRHGTDAAPAVPSLHKWLRAPVEQVEGYDFPPANRRWTAVALTRIAPSTAEAIEAHGYLARHGNPLELQRALTAIREDPDKAANAVPHLIAALVGDDAQVRTAAQKNEIITTLSTLGQLAAPAAAALRQVASGDDPRAAALAKAALRSLEGR
jgi:hypothetical protein